MPFECPIRVGKYLLLRHISSGGMADLYEGRLIGIENFHRHIAVKVVRTPAELTDNEVRTFHSMFLDEARVCGQLTHANVAQVYELGKISGLPYMAMELVEGHSLSQLRKRAGQSERMLPLPFIAYTLSQAALGLDYAHRSSALDGTPLRLVHRDVSPENILLSYEGEVKVIDFGVAQAAQRRRQTREGGPRGKLAYMPPEQARGEAVDARADVFGLGAVLFELLTGQRVYAQEGAELYRAARDGMLPDLGRALQGVPEELARVAQRALALDPAGRFDSAADFNRALEPFTIEERSLFGADDAAQLVTELFPEQPNRRGASSDALPFATSELRTEVLETFEATFYKRPTVEIPALPASSVRERRPLSDTLRSFTELRRSLSGLPWWENDWRFGLRAFGLALGLLACLWAWTPVDRALERTLVSRLPPIEGYLLIESDGKAPTRISIDFGAARVLPREPLPLSFGEHTLEFTLVSADGRRFSTVRTVTLERTHTRRTPLRVAFRVTPAGPASKDPRPSTGP